MLCLICNLVSQINRFKVEVYSCILHAVCFSYIPWNVHAPSPGVYDFGGQQDLATFIKTAQTVGLLVILRPGPYIYGEWDFVSIILWQCLNTLS